MYRKDLDNIKTTYKREYIESKIREILSEFTFKGGDSDYRGFHFDGKNQAGTEFSIEQLPSSQNEIDGEEKFVDLTVSGDNKNNVEETYNKIINFLSNQ
jgi:hypothetical protein